MNNLTKRSISGVAFIIIMTGALLFNVWSYLILMTIIIIFSTKEYFSLSGIQNYHRVTMILSLTASLFLFYCSTMVAIRGIDQHFLLLTIIPLIFIMVSALYNKQYNIHKGSGAQREPNGYEMLPWAYSAFFYTGVPFALTTLIITDGNGNYTGKVLLSMFIILWACDVGAYCLGSTLGKKINYKLFPSISPNKTWTGFFGAVISAITAGLVVKLCGLLEISYVHIIAVSIIITIFGVLGDLVESQLKRNFGVKDSGNIMPGHGGMLDRFDGALLAFPVAVLYLYFFVNI